MTDWVGGQAFDLHPDGSLRAAQYALQRFTDLGVEIPPTNRLDQARRLIEDLNEGRLELTSEDPLLIRRVTEAQWTIFDLYLIARSTSPQAPPAYAEKISMALGGSDLPERDTNHLPRNTAFELLVAAFLTMGDVPVTLGEPDLLAYLDSQELGVAAKRVQSAKKIRRRMKDAKKQIVRAELEGIVAVNVDVILLNETPLGDANAKGTTVDGHLAEVHKGDDDIIVESRVRGRVAFARTASWSFVDGHPVLQQDLFRQYRVYDRDGREGEALLADLDAAEARIRDRLEQL